MRSYKTVIKNLFHTCGLEINKFTPTHSDIAQLVVSLEHFKIDLVLDVGANQGQFGSEIRNSGYRGRIISFEPLSEAHATAKQISKNDPLWEIYSRCAIGAHSGTVEINVSKNSVSSSILPILVLHQEAAPNSAYCGKETVEVKSLDELQHSIINGAMRPFLKIDTQGYEWEVLKGAESVLKSVCGVLVELSLVHLYERQHLWDEVIDKLSKDGFTLWGLQNEFSDPRTGQSLQLNGLFFRI